MNTLFSRESDTYRNILDGRIMRIGRLLGRTSPHEPRLTRYTNDLSICDKKSQKKISEF